MVSAKTENPKDEKITNKDDSVTNKDGDNYLEKGETPTNQRKPDEERVPTVVPNNDNGEPGPPDKDQKMDEEEKERSKHIL
jgi:hypothetical protein